MTSEHQRSYLLNRRLQAKTYLGGVCVTCGTVDELEFDHVDPSTKVTEIAQAIAEHWAWDRLLIELDKCQLLCKSHHLEKSRRERNLGGGQNRINDPLHGTWARYANFKCRCDECREWKRLYRAKLVNARGHRRLAQ